MRKVLIALCLITVALLSLSIIQTQAQTCDWTHTFHFGTTADGDAGFTLSANTGIGSNSLYPASPDSGNWGFGISKTFSVGTATITGLSAYANIGSPSNYGGQLLVFSGHTPSSMCGTWYGAVVNCPGDQPTLTGLSITGGSLTIAYFGGSNILTGASSLYSITVAGSGTNPFTGYDPCNPVTAYFTTTPTPASGYAPLTVTFTNASTGEITGYDWDFVNSMTCDGMSIDSSSASPGSYTYTTPGSYVACLKVFGEGGLYDVYSAPIEVLDPDIGVQVLTVPLSPEDRDTRLSNVYKGMYSGAFLDAADVGWDGSGGSHTDNMVIASSNKRSADVMAISTGEIVRVAPLNIDRCTQFLSGAYPVLCAYAVPNVVAGTVFTSSLFRIDLFQAYRVLVSYPAMDGLVIEYWVSAPTVSEGDPITAGCIIGKTLPIDAIVNQDVSVGPISIDNTFNASIAVVWAWTYDDPTLFASYNAGKETDIPLLPALQTDSIPSLLCSQVDGYSSCRGDGSLSNESRWMKDGIVQWDPTGRGVTLQPGASIEDQLSLDSGTDFGVDVNAERLIDVASSLVVTLGTTTQEFEVKASRGVYSIPAAAVTPDLGSIYTFRIANNGSSPLFISRACVSPGSGNGEGTPISSTCSLINPSFDNALTGWITTASGSSPPGKVFLSDDQTIAQSVALAAGSYTLEIWSRAPAGWSGTGTNFAWLYAFGGSYSTSSVIPVSSFFGNPYSEYRFSIPLTLSAYTGTFTLKPDFTASGQAILDYVCLRPAVLPGGGTTGTLPPFDIACDTLPATPELGVDIGAWIYWQWQSMSQFYNCRLMIMLNKMFIVERDTLQFLRWQMLYWQNYGVMWTTWIKDLIPWLNGHFANIASGRSTTIYQSSAQCDNLFCLLTSGVNALQSVIDSTLETIQDLVRQIISGIRETPNFLYGILGDLISLLIAVLQAVWNAWSTMTSLLTSVIEAYNTATPLYIDAMPRCSVDPAGNAACVLLWVLENTIFSGPGALIIPIIIGYATLDMIIESFVKVRRAITKLRAL